MSRELSVRRAVTELMAQIWRTSVEEHDKLVQRNYDSALSSVADRVGYHIDGCDEAGVFLLMALTFVSRIDATSEQQRLQKRIAARLPRRPAHLYDKLLETPLQVWHVEQSSKPGDYGVGRPLVGPESDRARPLTGIVTYGGRPHPGAYAGWPVLWEGCRFLVLAVELSPFGVKLVENLPSDLADDDEGTYESYWRQLHYFVTDAVIEPTYDYQPPEPDRPLSLPERVDVGEWVGDIMNAAEGRGRGQLRLDVARSNARSEIQTVIDTFRRLRVDCLPPWEGSFHVDDQEVENALPLPALIGLYGLTPEGNLFGDRLEAFARWPLRVLGLEPSVLERAHLEPHQPLGALEAWRKGRGGREASEADKKAIDEALDRFRTQERWLATLLASREQGASFGTGVGYDTVMHGFAALFEPELLEVPLGALKLPQGSLPRLLKAFKKAKRKTVPETLGDLPQRARRLLAIRGIGNGTVGELAEALLDHALGWRITLAGFDPTQQPEVLAEGPDADDDLRSGLEELEKLLS